MSALGPARLTLGPLLFHWSAKKRRDFYFRIADEAPLDAVYVGEVVCSKREPFFAADFPRVVERLRAAGKEVVVSTLALVTSARELADLRELVASGVMVEANDVACIEILGGAPYVVGPYVNVFNEGARDYLASRGARRIVLPVELPATSIRVLAADPRGPAIEVQVFGRLPLSLAMRCYHARSSNLTKDHCQFVCGLDPDGLDAATIDGVEVLAINGTQTLSHGYGVLLQEMASLREDGVTHFRLSPHDIDMVRVAALYRAVLEGACEVPAALESLRALTGVVPYLNGFARGREGMSWSGMSWS